MDALQRVAQWVTARGAVRAIAHPIQPCVKTVAVVPNSPPMRRVIIQIQTAIGVDVRRASCHFASVSSRVYSASYASLKSTHDAFTLLVFIFGRVCLPQCLTVCT